MDELIKQFIVNSPLIALLLYQLNIIYQDAKADRILAREERRQMLDKLDTLSGSIQDLNNDVILLRRQYPAELVRTIDHPTSPKKPTS